MHPVPPDLRAEVVRRGHSGGVQPACERSPHVAEARARDAALDVVALADAGAVRRGVHVGVAARDHHSFTHQRSGLPAASPSTSVQFYHYVLFSG